jgi:probable F420-dependent oxidoreductase
MPWDKPASRMREFIQAMQSIWACWYEGKDLAFRGEFYTHTLMTPLFVPAQLHYGAPRVFLAAVGPKMTEVAAETADGLIAHAFTTEKYIRETTLPAIERGLAAAGRSRKDFEITCPVFVVSGRTEEELAANKVATRAQIAFYGSTPAYRPVLACHGWGDLQTELNQMSKKGLWKEMGERIDDDVLNAFAVVGEPEAILAPLAARCDGLVDRLLCSFSFVEDEQAALKKLQG